KKMNYLDSVFETLKKLEGSFALGIIFKKFNNLIVGARRGSPLAVGYADKEKYLGSDSYALNSMTKEVSYLDDGDICVLTKDKIDFFDKNKKKIKKKVHKLAQEKESYSKGNFKDFMSKEISEQPEVIKKCINEYLDKIRKEINIVNFPIDPKKISKVNLIACGTAYHACIVGKYWFEEFTSINVNVDVASEFRYRNNKIKENELYIFVSQSGETADTIAALDFCKKEGAKTCAIVNVTESSLSRLSDLVLPIYVGPEIGVASTKAFTGQILVLLLIILKIAKIRNEIKADEYSSIIKDLENIHSHVTLILNNQKLIEELAEDFINIKGSMFLGRGLSYPIALEGALKFKELTYLHAEGYPAGEMKHGPLALVENGMPVIVIAPKDRFYDKTISNMQEVIARGGKILLISDHGDEITTSENVWSEIRLPQIHKFLSPFLSTIPLQLLAYYVALKKGNDIDKPRNLAKSVTVE
ncbi:MAG: glutamine--fructose-6-phosphate transaminase (isomerizing), partial [Candidatus Fonsibacter sp.]